jgi:hypothetical protein
MTIPGGATDLAPGSGINANRLGGFGSDLWYDRANDAYYGLQDRGPGSGILEYQPRVQKFTLDVHPVSGAISNFQLQETIFFKNADGTEFFSGRSPAELNGSGDTLGLAIDPEGFVIGPTGNYYVADEYGPSVYEFQPVNVGGTTEARLLRAFTPPDNLLPRTAAGINHDVGGSVGPGEVPPVLLTGRQEGRGYEGLAISPDGSKLYGILQSPLQEEGAQNQGRRSRNIRIVEYDVAAGASARQFVYQVESIADINARVPDDCPVPPAAIPNCGDFTATQQGRNISASAIVAISDHEFFVIERDGRGVSVENPANLSIVDAHVATKRVYRVDLAGATDVSGISLAGSNDLPAGVFPVGKELFLDFQAELIAAGLPIPDKFEGLTIGPQLASGRFALIALTDNDFANVQTDATETLPFLQQDAYTNGIDARYTPADDTSTSYGMFGREDPLTNPDLGPLPAGYTLLPTRVYSFAAPVPEPSTCILMISALAAIACVVRGHRLNSCLLSELPPSNVADILRASGQVIINACRR